MKKLVPILLLVAVLVYAAFPPRHKNRSCEYLKRHHTPNLLMMCLFGRK